jgi:hypothetical protein
MFHCVLFIQKNLITYNYSAVMQLYIRIGIIPASGTILSKCREYTNKQKTSAAVHGWQFFFGPEDSMRRL